MLEQAGVLLLVVKIKELSFNKFPISVHPEC